MKLVFISVLLAGTCFKSHAQGDTVLRQTIPKAGKLHNNKPEGKGWVNLLKTGEDWNFENNFWQPTGSGQQK